MMHHVWPDDTAWHPLDATPATRIRGSDRVSVTNAALGEILGDSLSEYLIAQASGEVHPDPRRPRKYVESHEVKPKELTDDSLRG